MTTHKIRRRNDTAAPSPPSPAEPAATDRGDRRRLDPDDLEAIASMDPAEIARLLDATTVRPPRLEVGTRVRGRVARVGRENVFVDLGGKAEGMIERNELPDAAVGDDVAAFVIESDESGVHLSRRLGGSVARAVVMEAAGTRAPVEGKVVARNPGGYEVRIGTLRAFCPVSQIDRRPDADPDRYVGQTYDFHVVEAKDDGDVVVSRRTVVEDGLADRRDEFWRTGAIGDLRSGVVVSVQPFGAFVDMDGVEGLVPTARAHRPGDDAPGLAPGQAVEVRIVDLDAERRRITLAVREVEGTKPPPPHPVAPAEPQEGLGARVTGTVRQVMKNGLVVDLENGDSGWVPEREIELPPGTLLAQKFRAGHAIDARVVDHDPSRRRATLSLKEPEDDTWRASGPSARGSGFGTFADLLKGARKH
jgi:small subunit ribosomal protein S1